MYRTRVLLRKVVTSAIQPASSSSYMPSAAFMYGKVRRPGQKEHFVKVASELELFKDVYGLEALDRLEIKDETWEVLMEMGWDERFIYLIDLMEYREKQNKESEKSSIKKELISEQNLKLWRAGNMVYARNFHSLVDIYGPDFRRKIDNFYGRNILKQGEDLRSFVVDCRFMREFSVKTQAYFTNQMQALHEDNWTSNLPFSVNFVNYQADQQLVSIAKRNLLFQYGPSSKSVNFQRHPFVPVITPRRVDSVIEKENLLYISPRATQFVPEVIPSEIKGVVICLSNDTSPSTSSHSACINERVQPYQLPFKRIISSPTFRPQGVQLWQYARIFRQYFAGSTIDESIRQNMDNLLRKRSLNEPVKDKDDKQEVFRSAMYHINNCSNGEYQKKRNDSTPSFSSSRRNPSDTSTTSQSSPKRHYRHRT